MWRGNLPTGSRLAAGHTLGKDSAEALVLRPLSASRAAVERFVVRAAGFAKTRVWSGRLATSGASLSCADVDGDGRSDLLALTPRSARGSIVRVLLSRGDTLDVHAAWSSGTMTASGLRLASGASLPVFVSDESEITRRTRAPCSSVSSRSRVPTRA